MCRTRQIVAAITQRLDAQEKTKRAYVVWQTKQLAAFIVNTTPDMESEGHDRMMTLIKEMAIVPDDLDIADLISNEDFDPEDDEAAIQRAIQKQSFGSLEMMMTSHTLSGLAPPNEG